MSRLHRNKVKQGLADERRKLINHYMERSDDAQPATEGALPAATREESEAPVPTRSASDLTPPGSVQPDDDPGDGSEERIHPPHPQEHAKPADGSPAAAGVLQLSPEFLRPQEFGTALRTLREIDRLCEEIGRLGAEGDRLRALMAAASARLVPPS